MHQKNSTLLLGYGNFDRQDDGVSWHILTKVAKALGRDFPSDPMEEIINTGESPDFMFLLQLAPELAEIFAQYEKVCFIDAHTGTVPKDLNFQDLQSDFQKSPFTHHMTPQTCLSITESLYHANPEAILVSVRGFSFDFSRTLTPQTEQLADQAAERILEWLKQPTE